jgi:GTP-binding protein
VDAASFTDGELRAGEALFRRPWQFLLSAPRLETLPAAAGPEIAFAGRSNVGKSSLINALVGRRGLARTSNTPGRTQDLNFFTAAGVALMLVDMPGYGFAQAPKARVDEWTGLVRDYLRGRPTLVRVFLLIDARHGLKPVDLAVMALMDEAAVSYQAVLTKTDKIKPHELAEVERTTAGQLASHGAAYPTLLPTSAQTGAGIPELRAEIARLTTPQKP